jgi:hypothetical protein
MACFIAMLISREHDRMLCEQKVTAQIDALATCPE